MYPLLAGLPDVAFLHHMLFTFAVLVAHMAFETVRNPLESEVVLPVKDGFDLTPAPGIRVWSGVVVLATVGLYAAFW